MMKKTGLLLLACSAAILLTGCLGSDQDDLVEWMRQERANAKPRIEQISEPKKFVPQAYTETGAVEPFDNQRLLQALRRDSTSPAVRSDLIAPELNRPKEPLEAYPLDSMAMVGSLKRGGQQVALVMVDKLLYQVRVGSHLGQNYGRVMRIDETELALREIVQDAAGEWIERTATLQLQERSK